MSVTVASVEPTPRGAMLSRPRRPVRPPAPSRYGATTPGPTPVYGDCEFDDCSSRARTTCTDCNGEFCLKHAAHPEHR